MALWVKELVLPQLWCRSQLQLGFDASPGNFHMPWERPKKKKKFRYDEIDTNILLSKNLTDW